METESNPKAITKQRNSCQPPKLIIYIFLVFTLIFLVHFASFSFLFFSLSQFYCRALFGRLRGIVPDASIGPYHSQKTNALISKLRDSVTFLPLKDLRFVETATIGHTWFMSSLNDTHEENEAEYLYFPSQASKERLLCIKGRNSEDGTQNSYALAWPESLPDSATLLKGLTFVSDTSFDYGNLWHGVCAMAPFVGWSFKNGCMRPTRWVLFHWGELRDRWGRGYIILCKLILEKLKWRDSMEEAVLNCFERAVVTRHNQGRMGKAKKLQVFDLLRCKARRFCGINPLGEGQEVNRKGEPIIRLT